ncbi:MAG: hypothetical protein ACRDV3_11575 [Acidothermaceae bacterium]
MPSDFDFLQGWFDVSGRRLRDPLDPSSSWDDVPASSSSIVLFDGAVSIDEMWFPTEQRFGMSLRLFDPESQTWTVRWLDSRGDGLQPAVEGHWAAGRCWFTGPDSYRGRPLLASYSWSDVTETNARWEQCFSIDEGRTWQPNWVMRFTRRAHPAEHPQQPRVADDWDFLTGTCNVHHRRVVDPVGHALGGPSEVAEFDGVHVGRTYFSGAVSVDETTLAQPGQRGLTFRSYDPKTRQWSIYWVNSRTGRLEPPVHGKFADGVGRFEGSEQLAGHDVRVRFIWSDITSTTARWVQEFSVDGGDWDQNWEMTFRRPSEVTQ